MKRHIPIPKSPPKHFAIIVGDLGLTRTRGRNTPGCFPDGAEPTGTPSPWGAGVKTTAHGLGTAGSSLISSRSPDVSLQQPGCSSAAGLFLASPYVGVQSCCLSTERPTGSPCSPASPKEGCARVGDSSAWDAAQNGQDGGDIQCMGRTRATGVAGTLVHIQHQAVAELLAPSITSVREKGETCGAGERGCPRPHGVPGPPAQ